MPQVGEGTDVERSRRIGALDELREALADERALPKRERDSDIIQGLRNDIRAAERLLEAEGAADTAEEAAEETVRTLTRGQKISIGRRTNDMAREKFGTADLTKLNPQQRGSLTRTRNRLTREALEN